MNLMTQPAPGMAPELRVHRPDESGCEVGLWRINGYPARILIWTADQWEQLEERPEDAQYYPCGIWCCAAAGMTLGRIPHSWLG